MTTELKGVIGTVLNPTTQEEIRVADEYKIETGSLLRISYGPDIWAFIDDKTNRKNPEDSGTIITTAAWTYDEKKTVVPKGTDAPAIELGLPEELGHIKVY